MEDNAELEDVSPCYHISFNDGDSQEDEDAEDAPPGLEKEVKTTVDALKEVNLGTDEVPRPTYLSALLEVDEEITYIGLLKEFRDVFSWSYKEMPGLDPKVVVHHLAVKNGARPVKQAQRRFRSNLVPLIETEVNKLIEAGFISEVKYPTWVSSIVPVRKKNGQIRVCVDFRDEFPLHIPELMIDATTGTRQCHLWMGYAEYFDDFLHKNVECYVDDLVVKSREKSDHLKDLRMVFELLQRYQLRMNPLKCAFGITSGKFLGFIVQHRGIKIDQAKAVKGQALANFLANHPIPDDWELTDELSDKDAMVIEVQPPWKMYFDGAAHRGRAALILGLEMAVEIKRLQLQVFGDSQLVINHLLGSYEVKKPELRPNYDYAKNLMGWVVPPPNEVEGEENEPKHLVTLSEVEKDEWRQPIIDYLCYGILPENLRRRTEIRRHSPRFLYYKDTLYRRSFEGVLLNAYGKKKHSKLCKRHILGKPFDNRLMNNICDLFGFKQCNSPMYNVVANGLAEAFNKTLCNLLKKVVSKSKQNWNDYMEEALWAYRTTHRTPTQATPYSLIYGVEAVLPLEHQIPSLRLAIQEEITYEENTRLQLAELEALDEKRLEAQ
ncbi:uncharacterized protein [Nicotiana tomentosiformis]|uniref:uncharacterized protein n=1 Tax=Nicotiana tomentosiformis TaxID=4098 RepID=UPI00388C8889